MCQFSHTRRHLGAGGPHRRGTVRRVARPLYADHRPPGRLPLACRPEDLDAYAEVRRRGETVGVASMEVESGGDICAEAKGVYKLIR